MTHLAAHSVWDWLARVGAKTLFFEPGSPWENGFNSKLRDELLNVEFFNDLREAKVLMSDGGSTTTQSDRTDY